MLVDIFAQFSDEIRPTQAAYNPRRSPFCDGSLLIRDCSVKRLLPRVARNTPSSPLSPTNHSCHRLLSYQHVFVDHGTAKGTCFVFQIPCQTSPSRPTLSTLPRFRRRMLRGDRSAYSTSGHAGFECTTYEVIHVRTSGSAFFCPAFSAASGLVDCSGRAAETCLPGDGIMRWASQCGPSSTSSTDRLFTAERSETWSRRFRTSIFFYCVLRISAEKEKDKIHQ